MQNEKKYDVFISKNSKDSAISKEIAEFLDMAGYTYFESEISLRQLGKSEYVDKIYEAIDSSQNMIVICSPREKGTGKELDSGWVKEEYSTFINEKNSGQKDGNLVVVLVDGIQPSELDIRLRSKECIQYSEYKSMLLDYITKEGAEEKTEEKRLFEEYFKKANQGDVVSQLQLAICYDYGKGVEQNQDLAFEWYKKSAEAGYSIAQYKCLSFMRHWRNPKRGVSYRYKWEMMNKAIKSLESEINLSKDSEKLYYLAVIYLYKDSFRQGKDSCDSPELTKSFVYSLESAKLGYAEAQSFVGLRFERGEGTEKDLHEALHWYTEAAEQGDKFAMYHLARLCMKDEINDYNSAVKWLQRGAGQGHIESASLLADLYFEGEKIGKDYFNAAKFYLYGAEHGNVHCQEKIAFCYENGLGVNKDISLAIDWYKKAAERGDPSAQYTMGEFRSFRPGIEDSYRYTYRNEVEAFYWFKKAANQGHLGALSRLSDYSEDPKKAIYYQCVSALLGNTCAIDSLGDIGSGELYGNGTPILEGLWAIREINEEDPVSLLAEYYYSMKSVQDGFDENTGRPKYRDRGWKDLVYRAKNGEDQVAYAIARACFVLAPHTNFEGLLSILTDAADRGHAQSQNLLGVFYAQKYSLPKETEYDWEYMNEHKAEKIAIQYWRKAALGGLPEAELNYGLALYYGISGIIDKQTGLTWILHAVEHGSVKAYKHYIKITKGINLDSHKELAIKCLHAAAISSKEAFHAIGDIYEHEMNYEIALKYYKEGAKKGDAQSFYGIYNCAKYGHVASVSPNEALQALYSAANMGYGWAIMYWIKENGSNPKDPHDPETAKWIEKAKQNGWKYTLFEHDNSISWI